MATTTQTSVQSGSQGLGTSLKVPLNGLLDAYEDSTVFLMRHAEGLHNVEARGENIHDPGLTTLGLAQCAHVQRTFSHDIDIVIASPLRRTIMTALFCFNKALKGTGERIALLPNLIETGDAPCNQGATPQNLEAEFGDFINASELGDSWMEGVHDRDHSHEQLSGRAIAARLDIRVVIAKYRQEHPEAGHLNVAVVSHGGFIPYLIKDWGGYRWLNTAFRAYRFENRYGIDFEETEESRQGRGATILQPGASDEANERGMELQRNFMARRLLAKNSGTSLFNFS